MSSLVEVLGWPATILFGLSLGLCGIGLVACIWLLIRIHKGYYR